jgi:hypothetical protein
MSEAAERDSFIADTGYLMCFGAMQGNRRHFYDAFQGSVTVPPAVRFELSDVATSPRKQPHEQKAAAVFAHKGREMLGDIPLQRRDEPERDTALNHLRSRRMPTAPAAPLSTGPDATAPGKSMNGNHCGEAEVLAIGNRSGMPLLMNDGDGVRYARRRKLRVEPFGASLGRLLPALTPQQLFQMWKKVDALHDTGIVIKGPQDFRRPKLHEVLSGR